MKLVSIIIPLYNAENYIVETINSCIEQTYDNIEIIVLDDCSTDCSALRVKPIAQSNSKVHFIQNERNLGFIATVNKGIEIAKGKRILVLGDDDVLEKSHILTMSRLLDKGNFSFVYCSSRYIDEKGNEIGESKTLNINNNKLLIAKKNIINSCGLLINREMLDMVGHYPEYLGFRNYGEWYLWIKLLSVSDAAYITEIKSKYRIHSNNLTKSFFNKENIKAIRDYNLTCMRFAANIIDYSILEKFELFLFRAIYVLKMFYHLYIKRG